MKITFGIVCACSLALSTSITTAQTRYTNIADVPTIIHKGYKGPVKKVYFEQTNIRNDSSKKTFKEINEYNSSGFQTSNKSWEDGPDTFTYNYVYINNRLKKIVVYNNSGKQEYIIHAFWPGPHHYRKYDAETEDTTNWTSREDMYVNSEFRDSAYSLIISPNSSSETKIENIYNYKTNITKHKYTSSGNTERIEFKNILIAPDSYGNATIDYTINLATGDTTSIEKLKFEYY